MNFDFALILSVATLVAGLIWLVDVLFFKRARLEQAGADGEPPPQPVLFEYAESFFPVLLLVLVLRSFLGEPYQIPSGSMIPTLQVGDFILVNKYAYGLRLPVVGTKIMEVGDPDRGDIMVFIPPHDSSYFIKRVIGLPGDEVLYRNKQLFINGEPVSQELLARLPAERPIWQIVEEQLGATGHTIQQSTRFDNSPSYNHFERSETRYTWHVPEGMYFMMGDNRDNSEDSRFWGFVSEKSIVGKAVAVWMHKEPGLHLPTFNRAGWLN